MWFVAHSDFAYSISIPFALPVALLFAVLGITIGVKAFRQFSSAETTINPLEPESATTLVHTGLFSKSRNPMYVGLLLDLVGWGIWLGSLANIALLVLFVVLITELQIKPEEAALRRLFGEAYVEYCRKVRRWI